MPQVIGGGTVYGVGPGSNFRAPVNIKSAPGSSGAQSFNQVFDANGLLTFNALNPAVLAVSSVAITSAQIKALFTTPIAIIPAQGAGTIIIVDSLVLNYVYGTTQYTAGAAIQLSYGAGVTTPASVTVAATFLTSPTANQGILALGAMASNLTSVLLNTAVNITNATQNFATGDGTLLVTAYYAVLSGMK